MNYPNYSIIKVDGISKSWQYVADNLKPTCENLLSSAEEIGVCDWESLDQIVNLLRDNPGITRVTIDGPDADYEIRLA